MMKRFVVLGSLLVSAAAPAQDARSIVRQYMCGHEAQPDYGFETIDCVNCEITARGQNWIVFHRPPVIRGVRSDGPASGRLRDGDTLLSIDGLEITTPQAARRYANAAGGDTVEFRVRRAAATVTVRVPVNSLCAPLNRRFTWYANPNIAEYFRRLDTARMRFTTFRSDSTVFARDSIRWFVRVPGATDGRAFAPIVTYSWNLAHRVRTRGDSSPVTPGWIGIALFRTLRSPEQLRTQDVSGAVFLEAPEIAAVAPGSPADSAGIVAGDTLWGVDGVSIVTRDGARRFLEAPVGVPLYLHLRRSGMLIRVRVVPKEPPSEPPPSPLSAGQQPRN